MSTLAEYLDVLKPHLPGQLVSDEGFSRISKVAHLLPGSLAFTSLGFECSLGKPAADTDFGVCLRTDNSGPEILSGSLPDHDLSPSLLRHSQWQRLRSFGRNWANVSRSYLRGVHEAWLEFDIHDAGDDLPLPCLFFEPSGDYRKKTSPNLSREELLSLVRSVYTWTRGEDPSAEMLKTWQRCFRHLRRVDTLFLVGLMLSRPQAGGVRICIAMPSRQALMDYLRAIEWPGSAATLGSMLADIAPLVDHLWLHIDAGEGLSPKVGIECVYRGRPGPDREPRWYQLLALLIQNGLCLPEKRSALLEFTGSSETEMEDCPPALQAHAAEKAPGYRSFFRRTIISVKLNLQQDLTWQAKTYLAFNHYWQGFLHRFEGRGPWGIIG